MSAISAFRRSVPSLLQASRRTAFPAISHNVDKTHASPNDKGTHSEEAVHADRQHNPKVEEAVKDKHDHKASKTKEQAQKQK